MVTDCIIQFMVPQFIVDSSVLMTSLRVRPAIPEMDDSEILRLHLEYFAWARSMVTNATFAKFDNVYTEEGARAALNQFRVPGGQLLIAEIGGTAVGTGALRPISQRVAELKRIYVRERFRRQGVGGAILDELIRLARASRFERLVLSSAPFMEAARRLYPSRGFRPVPPFPESDVPDELRSRWFFFALDILGNGREAFQPEIPNRRS